MQLACAAGLASSLPTVLAAKADLARYEHTLTRVRPEDRHAPHE